MREIDKWDDPVFGYVPVGYREWYEKNSGTYYSDYFKRWFVNGKNFEEREAGSGKKFRIYPATKFQDRMIDAKAFIRSHMVGMGNYALGNSEVFELMSTGACVVKYEREGEWFDKNVKIN